MLFTIQENKIQYNLIYTLKNSKNYSSGLSNCPPTQKEAGFAHSKINYGSYNMDPLQ